MAENQEPEPPRVGTSVYLGTQRDREIGDGKKGHARQGLHSRVRHLWGHPWAGGSGVCKAVRPGSGVGLR